MTILGTIGSDELATESTSGEIIYGLEGHDLLKGVAGADVLYGGGGNDRLIGNAATTSSTNDNDELYGGAGDDLIVGQGGTFDRIFGGARYDAADGGAGNDYIEGGTHDDRLVGGDGDDELYGGPGSDSQAFFAPNTSGDIVTYIGGLFGGIGDDQLYGGNGDDFLDGGFGDDLLEGGDEGDNLQGADGNDELYGGGRSDVVFGGRGNDIMEGGSGSDRLEGGDDDDRIYGGDGYDGRGVAATTPDGNGGYMFDPVLLSAGLFGGSGDDTLYGGDGDDFLQGGPGFDVMFGGRGEDVFDFDSSDVIVEPTARFTIDRSGNPKQIGNAVPDDKICDFSREEGDVIDLKGIDAKKSRPGNQKFKYIAASEFNGKKGELQFEKGKVGGDVNGDGKADFVVKVDVAKLSADDFVL